MQTTRHFLASCWVLLVGLPLAPAFGQTLVAERPSAGSQPGQAATTCQESGRSVVVRAGRLSVEAEDESLIALLGAIACRTPLAISAAPEIEADRISIAFAALPVDEGLRRILRAYDAFFYYAGGHPRLCSRACGCFRKGRDAASRRSTSRPGLVMPISRRG